MLLSPCSLLIPLMRQERFISQTLFQHNIVWVYVHRVLEKVGNFKVEVRIPVKHFHL